MSGFPKRQTMGAARRLAELKWTSNQRSRDYFTTKSIHFICDKGRRKLGEMAPQSTDVAVKSTKTERYFTMNEVRQHTTEDDCWVVYKDGVYDLRKWIKSHPGGPLPILYMAGHDCTDVFNAFHPSWVEEKKLPYFRIGQIKEINGPKLKTGLAEDLQKLRGDLLREGFLDTNYWFYIRQAVALAFLFALIIYCVVFSQNIWLQLGAAVLVSLFWQQSAFIGHDTGHHAITHDATWDNTIGVVTGNLVTGVSLSWWIQSHNAHHISTNSVELDPDIQHLPVLAITDKFFKSVKSFYHDKVLHFDKLAYLFVSYQHWLFYVVMGFARYFMYLQSFLMVLFSPNVRLHRGLEFLSLCMFWVWYLTLVSYLPTWPTRLLFVFVSHFLVGIIHIQITLSHFSMETYHGLPLDAFDNDEFIQSQLQTTMDIDCHPWLDFFHGGLQFQIEHHLFPRVSRQYLRRVQERVRAMCKKHGVNYMSMSFVAANMHVIENLRNTAAKAQGFSPLIWEGINAVG